jgi:hypothetical protein
VSLTLGIDFDSYGLHVCALPDDGGPPVVVTAKLRKKGDGEHQAIQAVGAALANAVERVRVLHDGRFTPPNVGEAWIERGFGASRRADFVLGAIYGATIAASTSVLPGTAMRPLLAADWKRDITGECGITTKTGGRGNGNVKKEIANQCATQIWSDTWPLSIVPTDPNHLDAFSVAWAGQRR